MTSFDARRRPLLRPAGGTGKGVAMKLYYAPGTRASRPRWLLEELRVPYALVRVGISARPFASWRAFGRRLGWAYLTFRVNWPDASPWRIRQEREKYRLERQAGESDAASPV